MPSATDELRDKMNTYFGDPIDDGGPIKYLTDQGYTIGRGGIITPPQPNKPWTEKEGDCIEFLVDEWDYGYDPEDGK